MALTNAEIQKRYRDSHKEQRAEYQRQAAASGRKSQWSATYYQKHKEVLKAKARTEAYKIRHRIYDQRWGKKTSIRVTNPDRYNQYLIDKNRRLRLGAIKSANIRRKYTPETRRVAKALRTSIDNCLRRQKSVRYFKSFELLGLSPHEFREYIATKFQEGMSWDNWGEWELDHIRPAASFAATLVFPLH